MNKSVREHRMIGLVRVAWPKSATCYSVKQRNVSAQYVNMSTAMLGSQSKMPRVCVLVWPLESWRLGVTWTLGSWKPAAWAAYLPIIRRRRVDRLHGGWLLESQNLSPLHSFEFWIPMSRPVPSSDVPTYPRMSRVKLALWWVIISVQEQVPTTCPHLKSKYINSES